METEEEKQAVDCTEEKKAQDPNKVFFDELSNGFLYVILFIVFLTLFTKYIAQVTRVTGQSMENNFHDGERVLISKMAYWSEDPQRFDIVIAGIRNNGQHMDLIKRVIGLPGETVQIKDGYIYINGELLEEEYGKEPIWNEKEDGRDNLGIARDGVTLGPDEYFILGDNRNHSSDSRAIGVFPKRAIAGKVVLRIRPFTKY